MPTQAAAYIRVSAISQAISGLGLQDQKSRIEAYATFRDLEITELIADEAISATTPLQDRPGGNRLLQIAREGSVRAIIALKLDRLFRNTVDALSIAQELDRLDISLHIVDFNGTAIDTKTAAGRFMLTMFAAVAQMERDFISERTAAALKVKRLKGQKTGGYEPYGYAVLPNGLLDPIPEEQRILDVIRLYRSYGRSAQNIADELNDKGIPAKLGGQWSEKQVRRMANRKNRWVERPGTI